MPGLSLITGGTGFAGSHLIDHLLDAETRVAAWSHRGGRESAAAQRPVHWSSVDLLDRGDVARAIAALRPAVIYHCAGVAHVGESWTEPARALQVNVMGTHHVLEAVREARLECAVLVTGSALVYRPSTGLLSEDDPIGPADPYGVSKLAQEMLAMRMSQVPVFVVRPFNHAGPRQSDSYVTSSFARQIAEIELGLREPVLRVGNLDAERDITDVRDTVRAYRLVVRHGRPLRPYNVCSGRGYRVRDLLETLVGMSSRAISVSIDPSRFRPSDNPVIRGNRSRIGAEAQWEPRIPIERTLGDLLRYWRERLRTATGS